MRIEFHVCSFISFNGPVKTKLCVCNISEGLEPFVETEYHFVYVCSKYSNPRNSWFENLVKPENFENLDQGSKLGIALNLPENVKSTSQFIIMPITGNGLGEIKLVSNVIFSLLTVELWQPT